jgi:hypothetical protein
MDTGEGGGAVIWLICLLAILVVFGGDAAIDGILGLLLVLVSGIFALFEES